MGKEDQQMKKMWRATLFVGLLVGIIALAGCQLFNKKAAPKAIPTATSKVAKPTVPEVNYTSLSTGDRAKVTFTFKANKNSDSAQASVAMTVTNQTSKTVQFDRSKFIISINPDTTVASKLTGLLALKPGKSKQLSNVFSQVSDQYFSGAGIFLYLNQHYPLAYTYNASSQDGATSANLKDKEVIALNTPQTKSTQTAAPANSSSAANGNSVNNTASSVANNSSANTTNPVRSAAQSSAAVSSTPAAVINNSTEAITLIAHSLAADPGGFTATPVTSGWRVTFKPAFNFSPLDVIVHPDGSATYSDGTTRTFAQLYAPTGTD